MKVYSKQIEQQNFSNLHRKIKALNGLDFLVSVKNVILRLKIEIQNNLLYFFTCFARKKPRKSTLKFNFPV